MIKPASAENIASAAGILRKGGVVAFPTETVYGLGASIEIDSAIHKIYSIKGRPSHNPLIAHFESVARIKSTIGVKLGGPQAHHFETLSKLWPGPLTLVLPCADSVSSVLRAGNPSIAVRIPDHPVALDLLRACEFGVAAPSANPSSYVSPTTAQHVVDGLGDHIDMILDGGPCRVGVESTIVSLLGERPEILRPGGIAAETLADLLGDLDVVAPGGAREVIAPGQLREHYSPRSRLKFLTDLISSEIPSNSALLKMSAANPAADIEGRFRQIVSLSRSGDAREIAANLFAELRRLDDGNFDLIAVESCPEFGLGSAIMDRLRRATARFQ
jgi:L-threonylcarbamoyladenylate synthase